MRLVIARCSVDYAGRLTAHLPSAPRLILLNDYRTFAEAESHLDHFIEAVYNQKRLHSSLGYLPPVEFEAAFVLNGRR